MRYLACLLFLTLVTAAQAGTYARLRTPLGDIELELFDEDKPGTVQNFIRYVQSGRYVDSFIHRCNPAFVIQGGGYYVKDRGTTNEIVDAIQTFGNISNEFGIGKRYSNVYGTISMAKRGGDTNSASSQWFLNLADNSFLDAPDTNGFFTVFGRVVRGTNVLNKFRTFSYSSPTNSIAAYAPPFSELPVLHNTGDVFTNLIYVDVSLLNVQMQSFSNHTRQISWNSVAGATNRVEFTPNFPPTWSKLAVTNGTGNALTVLDSNTNSPRRFYRVRVDF
jgi:cyclophilin family peptidyl-prolyl cis-trans isomerase